MLEVWSKKSNIQIMGFQKREQRKLLYSWAHLKPLELCTCVLPTQLLPQSPLPLQLYKCMPITRASAVANLCATGISLFCWFQPLPLPLCLQLYPDILQVSATGVTHTTSFGHHCYLPTFLAAGLEEPLKSPTTIVDTMDPLQVSTRITWLVMLWTHVA